jgi:hypothetical protein
LSISHSCIQDAAYTLQRQGTATFPEPSEASRQKETHWITTSKVVTNMVK